MSKTATQTDKINIQFKVQMDTVYFDIVKFFEQMYPSKSRAESLKLALKDFRAICIAFNVKCYSDLLKKLKNGIEGDDNNKS